jgi:hypothetical protein
MRPYKSDGKGVSMDKEVKDRVEEIQQRIVQLRDSL